MPVLLDQLSLILAHPFPQLSSSPTIQRAVSKVSVVSGVSAGLESSLISDSTKRKRDRVDSDVPTQSFHIQGTAGVAESGVAGSPRAAESFGLMAFNS